MSDALIDRLATVERQFRDLKMLMAGMAVAGLGLGAWVTYVNATAQNAAATAEVAEATIAEATTHAVRAVGQAADLVRDSLVASSSVAIDSAIDQRLDGFATVDALHPFVRRDALSDFVRNDALHTLATKSDLAGYVQLGALADRLQNDPLFRNEVRDLALTELNTALNRALVRTVDGPTTGSVRAAEVRCEGGEVFVAGGFSLQDVGPNGQVEIRHNRPLQDGSGWRVQARDVQSAGSWTPRAWALCVAM